MAKRSRASWSNVDAFNPNASGGPRAAPLRLYTFAISHFSEKVRWALDWTQLEYEERVLLPGPHLLVVRRRAPKSTVPLLEAGGEVVQGSGAILDFLEQRYQAGCLRPVGSVRSTSEEIEALADKAFGRGAQRIVYEQLLPERATTTRLWSAGSPGWSTWVYALAYPFIANALRRRYDVNPASSERAKSELRSALTRTDSILQRQPYLDGERPGRTDITVAALLAPLCLPPQHRVQWPRLTPALQAFTQELDAHPTIQHVLRMYRDHRRHQ